MLAKWGSLSYFIGEVSEPREASDLFKVSWLMCGPVLSRTRLLTLVLALLNSWLLWAPPGRGCFPQHLAQAWPREIQEAEIPHTWGSEAWELGGAFIPEGQSKLLSFSLWMPGIQGQLAVGGSALESL